MANHVVRLRLRTSGFARKGIINPTKYEFGSDDFIISRFKYANRLYNEMVSWINENEELRVSSEEYKTLAKVMRLRSVLKEKLKEGNLSKEEVNKIKSIIKTIDSKSKDWWIELNTKFNLNFGKFVNPKEKYGRVSSLYQEFLKENKIPSEVATASIGNAISAYQKRKSNGTSDRTLKYKKLRDLSSIQYRKVGFKLLDTGLILSKDRKSRVYFPFEFRSTDEQRLLYAMEFEKLALVTITRRERKNGTYVFHANLVFSGTPYNVSYLGPDGVQVGIDMGVSKVVAYASNGVVKTFELSVGKEYADKLSSLQRRLEWKRRLGNPDNYNEDGTIKTGKLTWDYSKQYKKLRSELKNLNRYISDVRKNKLNDITREILSMGDSFYVESLDYASMQKRKDLEKRIDGSGYKSRANYGSSLLYASPSMLRTKLEEKLGYHGKELVKVSTYDSKLSQINHLTGVYKRYDLSKKYRKVGGININRRLYTAYLLSQYSGDITFSDVSSKSFDCMLEANKIVSDF